MTETGNETEERGVDPGRDGAADRADSGGSDGGAAVPVRVEPDAAVVSVGARVPPDRPEETPVALRPAAAARTLARRLRGAVADLARGGRTRSGE
ncbi:hypothetical protein [Halobaculum sp. EA56]|uniref:hypothetical protein n=1 Tax=Halobaculum sp. EA56 TaxID=3421648 RepID=UPI003EB6EC3A